MQAMMNWQARMVSTPKLDDCRSQVKTNGILSVKR